MQHKGILMVMSGFSGAGKGTIVKRMLEKYPEQYKLSVSAVLTVLFTEDPLWGRRSCILALCSSILFYALLKKTIVYLLFWQR